jgi:hypothetical protein
LGRVVTIMQKLCPLAAVLLFGLSMSGLGCGGDPRLKPTYPVRGQVMFQGKPAAGAALFFRAVGVEDHPWTRPTAVVDEQGNFIVSTYRENDGMPAGKYEVVITWLPKGYDGPPEKANKLPMRYADPSTSGLTAEVPKAETVLPPFNLVK